MEIPLFQVDAFTQRPFGGNPAAVCPLERWLPEALLQALAMENQLSETAYLVGGRGRYQLRWFTPAVEVDLCGHATLAAALVVCRHLEPGCSEIVFDTRSGPLGVSRQGDRFQLDLPLSPIVPCETPAALRQGLGCEPRAVLKGPDYLAVFDTEDAVRGLNPDFRRLAQLDSRGLIVTAPGRDCDFVSRFFAPQSGIDEDPVTGSAHTSLVPYWAQQTGRREFFARQVSRRGGELWCTLAGQRVLIAGCAVEVLRGTVYLEDELAKAEH